MKEIILTNGFTAFVDDEDYTRISAHMNWYAHKENGICYAVRYDRTENGKKIKIHMHREVLYLVAGDGKVCDHINRNSLDNTRSNLRVVSKAINNRNCKMRSSNTSGYTGVHWHKKTRKWAASIRINKSKTYLGYFDSPVAASTAYNKALNDVMSKLIVEEVKE